MKISKSELKNIIKEVFLNEDVNNNSTMAVQYEAVLNDIRELKESLNQLSHNIALEKQAYESAPNKGMAYKLFQDKYNHLIVKIHDITTDIEESRLQDASVRLNEELNPKRGEEFYNIKNEFEQIKHYLNSSIKLIENRWNYGFDPQYAFLEKMSTAAKIALPEIKRAYKHISDVLAEQTPYIDAEAKKNLK